jgi:hypothetical protein
MNRRKFIAASAGLACFPLAGVTQQKLPQEAVSFLSHFERIELAPGYSSEFPLCFLQDDKVSSQIVADDREYIFSKEKDYAVVPLFEKTGEALEKDAKALLLMAALQARQVQVLTKNLFSHICKTKKDLQRVTVDGDFAIATFGVDTCVHVMRENLHGLAVLDNKQVFAAFLM